MNDLPPGMITGTLGELFVQMKLLEFGIQAAPPIKDTGNDLIAIKGRIIKSIQVKTTNHGCPPNRNNLGIYDLLFLVNFSFDENQNIDFNRTEILIEKTGNRTQYLFNKATIDSLWSE